MRDANEGKDKIIFKHVRGRVLGRGDDYKWEEEHPQGWDEIKNAVSWLLRAFKWKGWTLENPYREPDGPFIRDVKQKYGHIRIHSHLPAKQDAKEFLDILEHCIKEFPGIEDFLDPDEAQEEVIREIPIEVGNYGPEGLILRLQNKSDSDLMHEVAGQDLINYQQDLRKLYSDYMIEDIQKQSETKTIVQYEHHGNIVRTFKEMKGKHRDHCLCYWCSKFQPNTVNNCSIAQSNYENCQRFGIVTPIWECPEFDPKEPMDIQYHD